ncbi:uncharacterized protein LOC115737532 [Rhodamnia argentea]|uniref:Uncharacterized protein LOC115737532 n=1 Tax=Rhodamnia argentea TaxID=178133 RepID=A0A8B8NSS7_9MYRT|nr:uncharacterized protein LOC115737532 [Rhodamnia argentea]
MRLLKTLSSLKRQSPKPHFLHSAVRKPLSPHPHCSFATGAASKSSTRSHAEENINCKKKPLDVFFKEAVGLSPKTDERDRESGSDGARSELGLKLKRLEEEVRILESRDDGPKSDAAVPEQDQRAPPASLYDLYVDGKREKPKRPPEGVLVIKDLSPYAEAFLSHLHEEGYFREANFLKKNGKWDASRFEDSYSRDFVKFAAEKFGKDHQEIAKWLSGSDLKKIALFGCPSTAKKNVFAAKRLRSFFSIQEDNVCRECVLRESCKFVNQSVWNSETNALRLDTVMKVITLYALELVPSQLKITQELKDSVSRMLRDILKLSQTTLQV